MTSIFVFGDAHIGSTVGLCDHTTELDDGGQYRPSPGQSWLRRCWGETLEWVEARKSGDLYTVCAGDLVEGDFKGRSAQVITRNPANITRMAADLIDPLAKMSRGLFMIRGTAAHVGQSAQLEEQIAKDIDAVQCPETGARSWWWLPLEVEGVRLDIAHHPGVGVSKAPAAKFNGIRALAARAVFEYADKGRPLPHLLIRAHNHTCRDSGDDYRVRAITIPAWTLATEYIYKLDPSAIADIGAVLVHISAGYYEVEIKRFKPAQVSIYSIGDLIK